MPLHSSVTVKLPEGARLQVQNAGMQDEFLTIDELDDDGKAIVQLQVHRQHFETLRCVMNFIEHGKFEAQISARGGTADALG